MEFRPLGNESSPFCRMVWFYTHIKIVFIFLSVWLIGTGGGSSALDPVFIPGSLQVRQKSGVGQEFANSSMFYFLKTWNFNPSFKWIYLKASFRRFGVLAKAMYDSDACEPDNVPMPLSSCYSVRTFLAELSPITQLQQSRSWLKSFKHFKIEFESTTHNNLNADQWSWFRCLWIRYSCTT